MDDAQAGKRRGTLTAAGLVAGGAVAGAILAGTLSAGAAPTPSPSPSGSAGSQARPSGGAGGLDGHGGPCDPGGRGGHRLDLTGTVTAVGTTTVTIKPASGAAKTYTVTSASDIDKNGEAQLSSLVVGDAVRFSVRPGTTTIDVLHAGDEAKNRPAGPPHGAPGAPGGPGGPGTMPPA